MICGRKRHRHHPKPPPPPNPPLPPVTLTVAWRNSDPAIADNDLIGWVAGLNAQVPDIQALWPHVRECSHVFVPQGSASPVGSVPAILKPTLPEAPGALGYHDNDGAGHASIFIASQTSIQAGVSISSVMSHEAAELTVDPSCTLTATAPSGDVWALEVGDPVESDSYEVGTPGGTHVEVSDFVGAAFFGMGPGPLDHNGVVTAPFTIAPGGYAVINGKSVFGRGPDTYHPAPSAKRAKENTVPTAPKPGYTTTEFWVALATQVLGFIGLLHPGIAVQHWTPIAQAASVIAAAIGAAFYAHSRAKVKAAAVGS